MSSIVILRRGYNAPFWTVFTLNFIAPKLVFSQASTDCGYGYIQSISSRLQRPMIKVERGRKYCLITVLIALCNFEQGTLIMALCTVSGEIKKLIQTVNGNCWSYLEFVG